MKRFFDWTMSSLTKKRKINSDEDSSSSSSSSTPSSLTPSSVPPPSSPRVWRHHVFPSFRGEDVRRDFLSHILVEFQRMAITPFIDNEIKRGESIGPELIGAIRESKIAVVLISRNYASSKWCLDELVEVMKCREELGQTVLAIFYRVDPSDVKKLRGDFGKVFKETCAGKTKEVIGRWKQALEKVATIAGYHSTNWDNEAAMIKKIATDISNKLNNSTPSSDFELVGMRAHLEELEPLLCLDSDEVRMIGIWGPPGIGKTTIARAAYNQLSSCYQLSVFMENIKVNYTRPCFDDYSAMLQFQQQLMSQITSHKDMEVSHLGVVHDRLKDKKVLVVLDGVDHILQLDAMAKKTWWFGPGSRIIITTQDQKLFRSHGINHIYKVNFPKYNDALKIFCMHAFGQTSPKDGFKKLSRRVTMLVGNLPLGLRVMGSYFRGMSKQEWIQSLPKLETSLDAGIESVLRFSYDALDDEDKYLFLHIACFFNGDEIKRVEKHLGKKFLEVRQRLNVLAEKSLLFFNKGLGSRLWMHSLLVKLGREIVRRQYMHEPGLRQFLVDGREIYEVLTSDAIGSKNVIGIDFEWGGKELLISERAFEGMCNLQFLRLVGYGYALNLPRGLSYLSPKLHLLDWSSFPMTCLPSTMNVEFLVELIMWHSKLEKLWEGNKPLPNLKKMDLEGSINLMVLPDLSTATNLERLNLRGCWNLRRLPSIARNAINIEKLDMSHCLSLTKLPSTIGNATNMKELDLFGCSSLVELPLSIGNLQKLEKLILQGCSKLEVLPTNIDLESLEELDLTECSMLKRFPEISTKVKVLGLKGTAIEEVPPSISSWSRLEKLDMSKCANLKSITKMYLTDTKIQEFPPLSSLRELGLSGCRKLISLPLFLPLQDLEKMDLSLCVNLKELHDLSTATNLLDLDLSDCSSLLKLPSSLGNATKLQKLNLRNCSSLVKLPFSIRNLQKLQRLILQGCSKLEILPTNINLSSLDELNLTDCLMLKSFPEISTNIKCLGLGGTRIEEVPLSIGSWSRLDELYMSYFKNLKEFPHALDIIKMLYFSDTEIQEVVPPWIKRFSRLHTLRLTGCRKLVSLPQIPDSLSWIFAEGCESLERLDMDLSNATNLLELNLRNCSSLRKLPSSIGNAINLKKLDLSHCSSLVELPLSIGNLEKLEKLRLGGCSKLEVLPTNINLKSLYKLDLTDCSMLKSFPEISTNIEELRLEGTRIKEVPLSIKSWPRLYNLCMSYFENLKEYPHALDIITVLDMSDTEIQELPPWIKTISRLHALDLRGCTKLVSLPQFPDSLSIIHAEGCESLERLDCSFRYPLSYLNFAKCFKLNQEARDLIIQTPIGMNGDFSVIPGREVPPYFTRRATCGDCSATIKLNESHLPKLIRFKACFWMLYKGDDTDWKARGSISVRRRKMVCLEAEVLREHLYIFELEEVVTSGELVFDFSFNKDNDMWAIGEFGLPELSH